MKNTSYTQLSLILDHLFIPAKVLAAGIHVDASMVSRWKSNKRKLNFNSEHYINIINFILDWDERVDYKNIIIFLIDYYPLASYKTRKDVYNVIDMWLSEKSISPVSLESNTILPVQSGSVQVNKLTTVKEKKTTLLYMLDVALSLSDNKTLYIMLDTPSDHLLNDESFYEKWIERLKLLANRGVSLHFIYSGHFFGSSIINMDNFLKLCFSHNYHAYYMTKSAGHPFMLCVLEGTFAITNFIYIPSEKNSTLFTFTDRELLYKFQHFYMSQLENCHQFVNYSSYPEHFFDHMEFADDPARKLCCYDPTPFLFPVPPELFEEILDYNNFNESKKKIIMDRYMAIIYRPFMTSSNMRTHYIILNISEMEKILTSSEYVIMCKILTDEEIVIPKKYFKKYLQTIHSFIRQHITETPPFDIFFTTNSTSRLPRDSSIFTIDGLFAYTHSYSINRYLMITNPSIAMDIYTYLKNVWDSLPEENHYTKSSLLLLENLIKKLS